MGKNKLSKFADMETYPHVFQVRSQSLREGAEFPMKGNWGKEFFQNNHPIVLELGCGKGEYTVGLAEMYPEKNFIGLDIKGARMWTGAKTALQKSMKNVAFLRTNIEMINHFFAPDEVSEIWITFPDPQMKKVTKRLTGTNFMRMYQNVMKENGIIHLKSDSPFLFTYTRAMIAENKYPVNVCLEDLYAEITEDPILNIRTYYEQQWLDRGLSIKYIQFQLTQRQEFIEPEIEIEPDTYRSFGRSKLKV